MVISTQQIVNHNILYECKEKTGAESGTVCPSVRPPLVRSALQLKLSSDLQFEIDSVDTDPIRTRTIRPVHAEGLRVLQPEAIGVTWQSGRVSISSPISIASTT